MVNIPPGKWSRITQTHTGWYVVQMPFALCTYWSKPGTDNSSQWLETDTLDQQLHQVELPVLCRLVKSTDSVAVLLGSVSYQLSTELAYVLANQEHDHHVAIMTCWCDMTCQITLVHALPIVFLIYKKAVKRISAISRHDAAIVSYIFIWCSDKICTVVEVSGQTWWQ